MELIFVLVGEHKEHRQKVEFARCMVEFPIDQTENRRTIVLQPGNFLDDSQARRQGSLGAQVHLLWRPDEMNARLAGELSLTRVEITAPEEPAK